jgi:putative redox protein
MSQHSSLTQATPVGTAKLPAVIPEAVTRIDSRYEGQLRCQASHGPSGTRLETDAPIDNQGKGERFSPTDLVATALSTCILTIMGIVAERHGWDLSGCSARVEKSMTQEAPRRIALLEVWIELPAHLNEKARRALQKAGDNCPVKLSLEGSVPMRLHWH